MAAGFGSLKIVHLGSLDRTNTGAAAGHIDDNCGELQTCQTGDTLGLQADSGAGGGRKRLCTSRCSAYYHVDRCDFALTLDKISANFRQPAGHVFRNFILRGNRIAREETAARANSSLRNGLISFQEYSFQNSLTSLFIDFDCCLRAENSTHLAANAGSFIFWNHREIAHCVYCRSIGQHIFFAGK